MRRIHTLQSDDHPPSSAELESGRSTPGSLVATDESGSTKFIFPPNSNLLMVPDVHSSGLDRGEVPPHKRVGNITSNDDKMAKT